MGTRSVQEKNGKIAFLINLLLVQALTGEETGIRLYRRQQEMKNRDRVVVFCGEHFGIFRNFEVAMLLGATVCEHALMGESQRTLLERYGVPRAATS